MEHLLQCFIFHNIFKYMIFQSRQKALMCGLKGFAVQYTDLMHFMHQTCAFYGKSTAKY